MFVKRGMLIVGLAVAFMPISPAYSGPDSNTLILPKMNYKEFKQINRTFDDPIQWSDGYEGVKIHYDYTSCTVRNPGQSGSVIDDVVGCFSMYSFGWEDEEGTRHTSFIKIKHNDWMP